MMPLALLQLLTAAAGAAAPSAPAADFSLSSYTAAAMETSPEVAQGLARYQAAASAYHAQAAAMILPSAAFSATAFPYGYNPANGYVFQTWRLNRDDIAFNTTLDLNVFNSFQDLQRTRAARLALESSAQAYWAARQDRALAAISAFYDLDSKLALLDVARQNLAAQKDQYDQSVDLYNNGMKSLADRLKSETDWRSSQLRLLDAQADEQRSREAFNVLIDREGLAPVALKADLSPGATTLPDVERDLASALEGRPEVAQAKKSVESAQVALEQATQQLLPVFKVDAVWNHDDQANFGVSNASLGIPNPNYYVGLSLSLPFGYNIASQVFGVAQARAAKKLAEKALAAAIRQVRSDVYASFIGLQHDLAAYSLAEEKADIAQRTLDLVADQYRENAADAIRMNQAQNDFLDAQVSKTLALHAIFVDRAQYKHAVGEQLW